MSITDEKKTKCNKRVSISYEKVKQRIVGLGLSPGTAFGIQRKHLQHLGPSIFVILSWKIAMGHNFIDSPYFSILISSVLLDKWS